MNRKKLIYSILKELERGNEPKQSDYDLNFELWGEIALLIRDEGLAKGIGVSYADDQIYIVNYSSAKLTMAGIEYLEQNNLLSKTYDTMKELREWIKL